MAESLKTAEDGWPCKNCFNNVKSTDKFCSDCGEKVSISTNVASTLNGIENTERVQSKSSSQTTSTLDLMKVREYYEKKLSWIDIVKLRKTHSSVIFSVIEKIMMLDYRAPLVTSLISDQNEENCEVKEYKITNRNPFHKLQNLTSNISKNAQSADSNAIHPMDIMNVIYNCCNNIVLQALMEKLFVCRLSIPLLFPDLQNSRSVFLVWSLRGIVPQWKCENMSQNRLSLVEIPQTFVTFMRIGRLYFSKSKILNELISSKHHNTFFHRDCENGMTSRFDSNGTVEATWYFPTDREDKGFKHMFSILNLRGDATIFTEQRNWLMQISHLCFLMIDLKSLKGKHYKKVSESRDCLQPKYCICFVCDTFERVKNCSTDLEMCQLWLQESAIQIFEVLCNWNEERLLSSGEWKTEIQTVIETFQKESIDGQSLVALTKTVSNYKFTIDEDEPLCKEAYLKAKQLTDLISEIAPLERKPEILPLQGKLWKKWGEIKKEQYRTKITDQNMEKFIAQNESKQHQVRLEQFDVIRKNMSSFINEMCSQLENDDETCANEYFINWMQVILNGWSRDIMPSLEANYYEQLKEIRENSSISVGDESRTINTRTKIKMLEEELSNSSFGIEHIFREFGQMYEAVDCFSKIKKEEFHQLLSDKQIQDILKLPKAVAYLVLKGMPFELMDGDTVFVPSVWVNAVFDEIKNIVGDKKLFIISVVGIQSSGKSTLLNTMFGLKFAVNAGRCTRGLYCLMIPIDKEDMEVDYDYVLVIDTEGLRAPELQEVSKVHDNELATLFIGLGNVTIINIKGENVAEINDILQIVIHAMIRMRLVKPNMLKPSCLFIHQNVPAVDANDKLKIEQQKLLLKLDKITLAAAQEEQMSNIKHFKDVITYDEHGHVYNMPDLWQGQPPMAPVNWEYSDQVGKVKTVLVKDIASISIPLTITRFSARILDLWDAILSENFVFSFRNMEEIRAYSQLDRKFIQLYWEFKDVSLKLQLYCHHIVISSDDPDKLQDQERVLENMIKVDLTEKYNVLQNKLETFFGEHEDKDILAQWRGRYENNLDNLCRDEICRIDRVLHENVNRKIRQLDTISKATVYCKERITDIAMDAAKSLRQQTDELKEVELLEYFHQEWPKWLEKFGLKSEVKESKQDILDAFKYDLDASFQVHSHLLKEELLRNALENPHDIEFGNFLPDLKVDDLDINIPTGLETIDSTKFISNCWSHAKSKCEEILTDVKTYVKECHDDDFQMGQASRVIQLINTFFNTSDDMKLDCGYSFQHKFRVRFTVNLCKCAAKEFIQNKINFQITNNPLEEIRKREKDFFTLFKNTYQNIAKERVAAEWVAGEISSWIQKIILTTLGPRITHAVVTDESSCFDTKQKFLCRILFDIGEKGNFKEFVNYLSVQDSFFVTKIHEFVGTVMNKSDKLNENRTFLESLIQNEAETYLMKMKTALNELLLIAPFANFDDYHSKFESKFGRPSVDNTNDSEISYPTERLKNLKTMEITDFSRFTQLLIDNLQHLTTSIFENVINQRKGLNENYDSSKLLSYLYFPSGTDPVDLLSDSVLGCTERCPFCKAPCKYTSKPHAGDHNSLQHCPNGAAGYRYTWNGKLSLENCQTLVASETEFMNDDTSDLYVLYREYRNYYPDWEISPDRKMESSLFWKWFMASFPNELADHFHAGIPEIPDEWKNITWQDAKDSLIKSTFE